MMLKLVLARGVNSAFLLFIITKDTEQLDPDTIQQVGENYSTYFRSLDVRVFHKA